MKIEQLKEMGIDSAMAESIIAVADEEKRQALEIIREYKERNAQLEKDCTMANEKFRKMCVENAVENALEKAGARNIIAAKALLNGESIIADTDGNVKGVEEQVKALAEDPSTSFLFGENRDIVGMSLPESAEEKSMGTENMNYTQLCAYLEANPDAKI